MRRKSRPGKRSAFYILISFIVCVTDYTCAADDVPQRLFRETTTLSFKLEGPFRTLTRDRSSEPELPGSLSYTGPGGRDIELNVEIKPRGHSRLRNCLFPPLRLDFKQASTKNTVFEGQDKLKLVTHCRSSRRNRDYIAREYQIYRAYNLVTERSFRVRWATIEYVDNESDRKSFTEPGFLIEDEQAAAARLGMQVLETESLQVAELDPAETTLMAMFQYMFGNLDWSALKGPPGENCCHNFKVLAHAGQPDGHFILPYDFDQSGFVEADYAVHNQSLGIRPRDRMYKGYCDMNDEVDAAVERLLRVRREWLDLIDAGPVSKYARRHGVRYIERSYMFIEDPGRVERYITRRCRE